MNKPGIWAYFHNANQYGNVRLNCLGTQKNIQEQEIELVNGLKVILYSEELETDGTILFSEIENDWISEVGWLSIVMENSFVI